MKIGSVLTTLYHVKHDWVKPDSLLWLTLGWGYLINKLVGWIGTEASNRCITRIRLYSEVPYRPRKPQVSSRQKYTKNVISNPSIVESINHSALEPNALTHSLTSNPRRRRADGSTSKFSLPSTLVLLTTNKLPSSRMSTLCLPLSPVTPSRR